MAVVTQQPVRRLFFGGSPTPGLPTGIWSALVTSTSDGTGGNNVASILFHLSGEPIGALLYHLGECHIIMTSAAASRAMGIQGQNLGRDGIQFRYTAQFTLPRFVDTGEASLEPADALGLRGILLGSPLFAGSTSSLDFETVNTDTEAVIVSARGYVWDQGALSVPGGPRMPANGLYRPI